MTRQKWEEDLYKKVTANKKDRIFLTTKTNSQENMAKGSTMTSMTLNSNVYHVMKFIPYQNKRGGRDE